MTYSKPELSVLGDASVLIEVQAKASESGDPDGQFNAPAYDLDE